MVPHSAETAYVWLPASEPGPILSLAVAGKPARVLDRAPGARPAGPAEVLLVHAPGLRDGSACAVRTGDPDAPVDGEARARMARWDDPDTPDVLRLVAERFEVEGDPPHVLERYLAFMAAWQAPGRILASFEGGSVAEVEAEAGGDVDAYSVTSLGLRRIELNRLDGADGRTTLWIDGPRPRHLYLDLGGDLVRSEFPDAPAPERPSVRPAVVESLHGLDIPLTDGLQAWVAGLCPRRADLAGPRTRTRVLAAVRLPSGEVAVLLESVGAPSDLPEAGLHSFGSLEPVEALVFRREDDAPPGADVRAQAVLLAPAAAGALCHRVSWTEGGEAVSAWIAETDVAHHAVPGLARAFAGVAEADPDLFDEVIHPLAAAPVADPVLGMAQSLEFGTVPEERRADLFVFADGDLEALHRTLAALALTRSGLLCAVHVVHFRPDLARPLAEACGRWSGLYGLPLRLWGYSRRTHEALVAERMADGDFPAVMLRAGLVPRRADWLPSALGLIENGAEIVLGGPEATEDAALDPGEFASLIEDWAHNRLDRPLSAAALASGRHPGIAAQVRLHTLEAYLLGLSLQRAASGAKVAGVGAMAFVDGGAGHRPDGLDARLDARSLRVMAQSQPSPKNKQ